MQRRREGGYGSPRTPAAEPADVRTRVFPGVRHEAHNEPTTRAEAEREITDFVTRVATAPPEPHEG